ncbi:unnamed protein product [Ectocarpus sp. CCAP 1310/34]|nr:unnamed protein product [Ectocarpus sp. CCAP 1310/34]
MARGVEGGAGETLPAGKEGGAGDTLPAGSEDGPAAAAVAAVAAAQRLALRVEGEAGGTLPAISEDGAGRNAMATIARPAMMATASVRHAVPAVPAVPAAQGRARRVEGEAGETLPAIGQDGTGAKPLGTTAHNPVMPSVRHAVAVAAAAAAAAAAGVVVVVAEATYPRCEVAGHEFPPTLFRANAVAAHGDRGHFQSAQGGSHGLGGGTANRGGPDMGVDAAGPMARAGRTGYPARGFGVEGAAVTPNTTGTPGVGPRALAGIVGNGRWSDTRLVGVYLAVVALWGYACIVRGVSELLLCLTPCFRGVPGRSGEAAAAAAVAAALEGAVASVVEAADAAARAQAAREAVMRGRVGREFARGERTRITSMVVLVQALYRGRAARREADVLRAAILTRARAKRQQQRRSRRRGR